MIESRFGLYISIGPPTLYDISIVALVIAAGFLMGMVPAYRAYRYSLADGMTIRI